jgi:radical SAM superfamily enzyme YgiQ (UPF0313 family)
MSRRIALIHPGVYDAWDPCAFPPWGLLCVGERARQRGWDVSVADLNGLDPASATLQLVEDLKPDAVGFTAKLGRGAFRLRQAVEAIRREHLGIHVVVGGPLVATYPDPTLPLWRGVDALVWGDGEDALIAWAEEGFPSSRLYGPTETDLDTVGIPSWWDGLSEYVHGPEFWPNMGVRAIHVAASRGCTGRCTFCYLNTQYPSHRFRQVSPDRMLADLDRMHEKLDVDGFYFVDDCFIDKPPARVRQLCNALIARGSPYRFGCDIQLRDLEDTELPLMMHRAGFRSLYLGLEAASAVVRHRLGKGLCRGSVEQSIRRTLDLGFVIRASIGIGWPGETTGEIEATLQLIDSIPGLAFDAYRYLPLPGAPLTRLWARRDGKRQELLSAETLGFADYSQYNSDYSDLPAGQLEPLWAELRRREAERLTTYVQGAQPSPG